MDDPFDLTVAPPAPVRELATFDPKVTRPLSPMLRERFEFAGTITVGGEVWVAAGDIAAATRKRQLLGNHKARREHWENSVPMRFEDGALSLFAYDPVSQEDVVYLVWTGRAVEPELWQYHSMDEQKFRDVNAFLRRQFT
jgi:hypothetical protein